MYAICYRFDSKDGKFLYDIYIQLQMSIHSYSVKGDPFFFNLKPGLKKC